MGIIFKSELTDFESESLTGVKNWLHEVAQEEEKKLGEIIYRFVSEENMLEINRKFLSHDYVTDIITFDDSYLKTLSGEIFICIEEVKRNAKRFGTGGFNDELHRVLVHGLLHLAGYDDKSEEQRNTMREKENYYLNSLNIS